jgi:lipopolysaccharide/colanic/teichoic acid biosynthesis glycosyltransferase
MEREHKHIIALPLRLKFSINKFMGLDEIAVAPSSSKNFKNLDHSKASWDLPLDVLSPFDPNHSKEKSKHMNVSKNQLIEEIGEDAFNYINSFVETHSPTTCLLSTTTRFNVINQPDGEFTSFVNFHRINDIKLLNKFFESVNSKLDNGGMFIGCAETRLLRKKRNMERFPWGINYCYLFLDYLVKRVFPKLSNPTKRIYFFLTKGRNRAISRTEVLGRLYSCGFEFVDEKYIGGLYYFVMKKVNEPLFPENPSYGPVFKMRRVGKGGKIIHVYKLRTMYPYSEYLQKFVYERNDLAEGGKMGDDFRVTTAGKFFRKFWIDELPMIINLFKGDLKIVGVRPLSQHFLSLYSQELKDLRLRHKPGLVPPFYADLPKTLDEIMDSEIRYLKAYEKNPIVTDVKYFFKSFYNILIKKARSQ